MTKLNQFVFAIVALLSVACGGETAAEAQDVGVAANVAATSSTAIDADSDGEIEANETDCAITDLDSDTEADSGEARCFGGCVVRCTSTGLCMTVCDVAR